MSLGIFTVLCLIAMRFDFSNSLPFHHFHGHDLMLSSNDTHCKCNWRYLQHYETKGCRPVYDESNPCNCPVRFQCSKLDIDPKVCRLNGQSYVVQERVNSSNPCEVCSCQLDYTTGKATIQCAPIECVKQSQPSSEGCYHYYEEGSCCPKEKCESNTKTVEKVKPFVCNYNDKEYKIGQKIYSEDDPCLICHCTEKWTGVNNASCQYFKCDLEKDIHKLQKGCIPIYHDKTCCPIEYHCPETISDDENEEPGFEGPDLCQEEPVFGGCHETFTRYYYNNKKESCDEFLFSGCKGNRNNFASAAECEAVCGASRPVEKNKKANMCFFDHRYHPVGDIIDIKHPTNCVSCVCQIPPDFTCIHKSCQGPPNNDYQNCQANVKPNACCAEYNCSSQGKRAINHGTPQTTVRRTTTTTPKPCEPIVCQGPLCRSVIGNNGCPACFCDECIRPKCPSECALKREPGGCPECTCPETSILLESPNHCPLLSCPSALCMKVSLPNQCPTCDCKLLCSAPKCPENCSVEQNVPEGKCPGCVCKKEKGPIYEVPNSLGPSRKDLCPTVPCDESFCRKIERDDGCLTCECPPSLVCSRPLCEPGCEVQTELTSGCPGCRCTNTTHALTQQRKTRQTSCLTPICHPGCHSVAKSDGCLTCKCEQCIPPKCICPTTVCEDGCHLDRNVSYGQCPVCVCTRSGYHLNKCSIPRCNAANCKLVSNDDGCLKCQCDDICLPPRCFCSIPVCNEGCIIDTDVREGRCPGCKCTQNAFIAPAVRTTTSPPQALCPSTSACDASHCHLKLDKQGCAYCHCESVTNRCPVQECNSGCRLGMHPSDGQCPKCICNFGKEDDDREYETVVVSRQKEARCPAVNCNDCAQILDSRGCSQCDCHVTNQRRNETPRPAGSRKPSTTTSKPCDDIDCRGPYCHAVLRDDGCSVCRCEECARIKCSSECALKQKPGECPECTCPGRSGGFETPRPAARRKPSTTTSKPCDAVVCQAPSCRSVLGDDGCPACRCEDCIRPKCSSNCALKQKPGQCQECSCPVRSTILDQSTGHSDRRQTHSCPNEACRGKRCRLVPAENGCQKCVCEEPCPTVNCNRPCILNENPGNGRCPSCLCSFGDK